MSDMLGNDIVDLSVDEFKYLNHKYIGRSLSDLEQEYLQNTSRKNVFLWSLWAAKEACYKASQKKNHQLIFSPASIALPQSYLAKLVNHDYESPLVNTCKYQSKVFQTQHSWIGVKAIHCLAVEADSSHVLSEVDVAISCHNELSEYAEQSVMVRKIAQQLLESKGVKASIERPLIQMNGYTKAGPPVLCSIENKQLLKHEISLSHDGSWVAVALKLHTE